MTVGQNFRLIEPRFPHRAETWEQKPTELENILTIPNLRGGNMGIGGSSLSSTQPLSIFSSGWLWVKVSNLLCFYTFSTLLLLALLFSLVKAPLAFVFYTLWILGLIFHKQTLLKNPRGDLGRFRIFGPCRKTSPTLIICYLWGNILLKRYPKLNEILRLPLSKGNPKDKLVSIHFLNFIVLRKGIIYFGHRCLIW